mmetsp:Transcript_21686/g.56291  ORF Transcript_21686/g.56291 Transcript_21686/m.56291 type:complete len:95 (+) Transcript_21686:817-1101(+)
MCSYMCCADMSIQAAILLTNFLAIGKGATARTPLDPAWSSAVSSRLLLSVQPSGGEPEGEKKEKVVTVSVQKESRPLRAKSSCSFRICKKGLHA